MTPPNYALLYMSVSSFRFSEQNLTGLLSQSRTFNLDHQITGLLLYAGGSFMQLLEGDQAIIEELMERIKKDVRHSDVVVLEKGPVIKRLFPEWSMAFLDFASPYVRTLPGYSTFLEKVTQVHEVSGASERHLQLLNYFKTLMTASNQSIQGLSDAIG
jgi:hypothetical protein